MFTFSTMKFHYRFRRPVHIIKFCGVEWELGNKQDVQGKLLCNVVVKGHGLEIYLEYYEHCIYSSSWLLQGIKSNLAVSVYRYPLSMFS